MSKDKKAYMDKYWICSKCAGGKKWKLPEDFVGTCTTGYCGHCKSARVDVLIPIVDFERGDIKPIFD